MAKLSKDMEDKINEFQSLQGQLQLIAAQTQQSKVQGDETTDALEKLENVTGKVYRFSGTLFLESTKEDAKKELEERLEVLKVRGGALKKQEERLRNRAEALRKELETASGLGGG
jgi:prefoldin beta subunit